MKPDVIFFKDLGKVSSRRTTKEGYLSVVADFARVGIQDYYVGEIPRNQVPPDLRDDPFTIVRLLRPENEVFNDSSMQSFSQKPVTNDHPPEHITSKNFKDFKDFQVGFSGNEVSKNQDRLRVPLLIQDAEAIKDIKAGKELLSAGYSSKVLWTSGVHEKFGAYDAIQSNIEGNHIAIVDSARGGENVKINDSWSDVNKAKSKKGVAKMALKRKISGVSIEFSDQGAEAVDGLVTALSDSEKEVGKLKVKLADETKAKDKLQGEFDAEKKNRLSDADVESKVSERLVIVDHARALSPDLDPKGKTLTDIRKEAVLAVEKDFNFKDEAGKDKSDEYVTAVFDTFYLKRDKKGTKSARKAGEGAGLGNEEEVSIADTAREKYLERSAEAWKGAVN